MDNNQLRAFKRDYYFSKGGKYNLEVQVPHLARLADIYHQRYLNSSNPDWTDCLKVSGKLKIKYHSCSSIPCANLLPNTDGNKYGYITSLLCDLNTI